MLRANRHHSIHLQRAWDKYGKESFTFEIIEEVPEEELFDVEQMYLDCLDFEYLFNIASICGGGLTRPLYKEENGMYGKNHTEESKEKMRQNRGDLSGDSNPFYGQSHTEETKQLLSDLASQKTGDKNPFYGKKHSKETKAKLSAKRKGKKPTNCKQPIINGVKYLSINDASKALDIHPTTISYRCKSKSFSNYKLTESV